MLAKNSAEIMKHLRETDKVLDIGGWAHPFNRANSVLDCEPYETRGFYNRARVFGKLIPPIGGTVEYFNRESWVQRDICSREPFPFADKEFDFVICSHTLEDIRDPLWVCSEIIRIGKAGYIEVPSRVSESCRGLEPGIAGLSHHRWLIDIGPKSIRFVPKYHRIHNFRYSLPASVLRKLTEEERVQWLFWDDSFHFSEPVQHGQSQLDELESFIQSVRPYSVALLMAGDMFSHIRQLFGRVSSRIGRGFGSNG